MNLALHSPGVTDGRREKFGCGMSQTASSEEDESKVRVMREFLQSWECRESSNEYRTAIINFFITIDSIVAINSRKELFVS